MRTFNKYRVRKIMRGKNYFIVGFIIILLISFIITIIKGETKTKSIYKESDKVASDNENMEKRIKKVDSNTYSNELGFTMEIPKDWEKASKTGCDIFTHKPSKTSVKIEKMEYNPQINNNTQENVQTILSTDGKNLLNYERKDNSTYIDYYQQMQGEIVCDFIEYVTWDKNNIMYLTFSCYDENYEKIKNTLDYMIDTIYWKKPNEIPSEYFLLFCKNGNFEVGIPTTFNFEIQDAAIAAIDDNTNTNIMVTYAENNKSIKDFEKNEIVRTASSDKQSFILKSFVYEGNACVVESTFSADDTMYSCLNYYMSDGKNIISVEAYAPIDSFDTDNIKNAISLIRSFN